MWLMWGFTYVAAQKSSFRKGEKLDYVVKMGPFVIATAQMEVLTESCPSKSDSSCLHLQIRGETVNPWRLAYPVNDIWGSYYDPAEEKPYFFYRYLREGGYRKYEHTTFNHQKDTVFVQTYHDAECSEKKNASQYRMSSTASWPQDMISGYYSIRNQSFDHLKAGDSVQVHVFFEDTFYDLNIRYLGTEEIKTKIGKLWTHVLTPLLPENKMFPERERIKMWLSKDRNHLLVKARAAFYLGHVSVEITKARHLKHKLQMTK